MVRRQCDVEPREVGAAHELVQHVHGILTVRHQHAFFDDDAAHVVPPDGQAGLEPELIERHSRGVFHGVRRELSYPGAADVQLFADVREQQTAPVGRRQCGDQ